MCTISLCMIVKNEAKNIERCLWDVCNYVDEIIIVDTGSTDGTPEICKRFGATVIQSVWCDDFSRSRNVSIDNATKEWILILDADEVVCKDHLKGIKALTTRRNVYAFLVRNTKNGVVTDFYFAKLFPRQEGVRFIGRVHESVITTGLQVIKTGIVVDHYGYQDEEVYMEKEFRNQRIICG